MNILAATHRSHALRQVIFFTYRMKRFHHLSILGGHRVGVGDTDIYFSAGSSDRLGSVPNMVDADPRQMMRIKGNIPIANAAKTLDHCTRSVCGTSPVSRSNDR